MHYKAGWVLLWLALDGVGCADVNSCMRNTDCNADARCINGECLIPPPSSAGTAGNADQTGNGDGSGGTTQKPSSTKGGGVSRGGTSASSSSRTSSAEAAGGSSVSASG